MKYHLPVSIPNDILLELLRSARAHRVSVEELILGMLEDYLEGSQTRGQPEVQKTTNVRSRPRRNLRPPRMH